MSVFHVQHTFLLHIHIIFYQNEPENVL